MLFIRAYVRLAPPPHHFAVNCGHRVFCDDVVYVCTVETATTPPPPSDNRRIGWRAFVSCILPYQLSPPVTNLVDSSPPARIYVLARPRVGRQAILSLLMSSLLPRPTAIYVYTVYNQKTTSDGIAATICGLVHHVDVEHQISTLWSNNFWSVNSHPVICLPLYGALNILKPLFIHRIW